MCVLVTPVKTGILQLLRNHLLIVSKKWTLRISWQVSVNDQGSIS